MLTSTFKITPLFSKEACFTYTAPTSWILYTIPHSQLGHSITVTPPPSTPTLLYATHSKLNLAYEVGALTMTLNIALIVAKQPQLQPPH